MNRLPYRCVLPTACLLFAPLIPAWAQQAYQSPPADLVKILEAPANPVTSISPDRQWVLVTVSDPRTITIRDMADSAYYLAGSKIRANPDYRIENIGIRSGTVSSIDGKLDRTLQVPPGGRLGLRRGQRPEIASVTRLCPMAGCQWRFWIRRRAARAASPHPD